MDPATLIGIGAAFAGLLSMMFMEGSNPMAIVLPAPLMLIALGTFGAAIAGSTMADLKKIVGWFKAAVLPPKVAPIAEQIDLLVSLSEKARKEGILALEGAVKDLDNDFLKRGLQGAIDGQDPEDLRDVLEAEVAAKKAGDKVAAKFFTAMGGYSPTIGIIGTVVGLIHVLENLSDPASLGPLIASAFVATLWGVLSANVMWLPMGAKITRISDLQAAEMELLIEGIAEIQAQSSPRALRSKLYALLPPAERPGAEKGKAEKGKAA